MSIKASNWAWEQQLAPVPKLVIMAIADNADDFGYCWPKLKTIASKCGVSERTVQRTIKDLLAAGLVTKNSRYDSAGRQISNGYTLEISGPDNLSPIPKKRRDGGDSGDPPAMTQPCRLRGDKALSTLKPPLNRKIESPEVDADHLVGLPKAEQRKIASMLDSLPATHRDEIRALLNEALGAQRIKKTPSGWVRSVIQRMISDSELPPITSARTEADYAQILIDKGISMEDAWQIARSTYINRQPLPSRSFG